MTLISLPPDPLLELVCGALQRLPNAVWLSLSGKLIRQLDPPSLTTLLSVPSAEANATVLQALPLILDASLNFFQNEGAMEAVSISFLFILRCSDIEVYLISVTRTLILYKRFLTVWKK